MDSKNMNYIFNVEYFKNISIDQNNIECSDLQKNNDQIFSFKFVRDDTLDEWSKIDNYQNFDLYTMYPGMLIGVGYPHEIAIDGALKCGFSFDYVTGLPYIPGSSLKGMLRSYFPGDGKSNEVDEECKEYIDGLLQELGFEKQEINIELLKEDMFEKGDIFLGAYPKVNNEQRILDSEFITPHKEKFKNPIPISLLKVRPGVCFQFGFVFRDAEDVIISSEKKLELCRKILLDMGIGAKTNIGFGALSENKPKIHKLVKKQGANSNTKENSDKKGFANTCTKCNKNFCTKKDENTYYDICYSCFKKKNCSKMR
ncbi:MAG: type III-B CRISPR module RAMP protein Cmr6 [Lachnospiraceae bacterium]|nr:type III-B CRISPR module RAMP protein Cmr6 [Lachnospiraceae bacterium]